MLKRPVDKNNASALRGAEFKKLVQELDIGHLEEPIGDVPDSVDHGAALLSQY